MHERGASSGHRVGRARRYASNADRQAAYRHRTLRRILDSGWAAADAEDAPCLAVAIPAMS